VNTLALRAGAGARLGSGTRSRRADPDASVRRRIGWIWGLLWVNVLSFGAAPMVIHIPTVLGKAITQGSLWVALLIALTLNRKVFLKPNTYMVIVTVLALTSLVVSLATLHPGSGYRGVRLLGFTGTLWLLTPWFGRSDMLLLRCHLRAVVTVIIVSFIGMCISPHKAFSGGRLIGDVWPIPPTQLGHYGAIAGGLAVVLWFCGMLSRNAALGLTALSFATIILSHTRTALLAMIAAIAVAGASLFLTRRRVRKTMMVVLIVGLLLSLLFLPFASKWFLRGQKGSSFSDLSGRTLVWHQLLNEPRSEVQVLFGDGLSNKSFDGKAIDDSWLAAYQDQGLVGDVLIGLFLLALIAAAAKAPPGRGRALALFLIAYALIASYTEVGLGDASPYILDLTVAASLLVAASRARPAARDGTAPVRFRRQTSLATGAASRADGFVKEKTTAAFTRLGMGKDGARRAGMTMADQCFASASNFVVGVAVARIAGPVGLGAFSLAYGTWILVNTMHRALITDPMAIYRDLAWGRQAAAIRQGFAAEVVLGLGASVIFALIGGVLWACGLTSFGAGMLALAPWVVFLDLQDYWRWVAFMKGKPAKALSNDVVFTVVQAFGFAFVFIAGMHSVFAVVSAWGVGAIAGTVYGLNQFSVGPSFRGGVELLRSRWALTRWNAGSLATGWGGTQLYLILAGGLLGPAALGGLKASQSLVTGPSSVVIHAGGSLGLPEASRGLANDGWAGLRKVCRFITLAALLSVGLFGAIVILWAGPLMRLVYGPSFSGYSETAQLTAMAFILAGFFMGPILALKATKRTRQLFVTQVIALISSIACVLIFGHLYGVNGAAAAALISNALVLAALLIYQRAARLSVQHSPEESDTGTVPVAPGGVQLAEGDVS
jgi:O-antigen/teichoic acid export membrane protein